MPQNTLDDTSILFQVIVQRHQAITWAIAEPDLCRRMSSLGSNKFKVGWSFVIT